ncbi:MAG TPA: galactose-1-phosphate uridylyltransferase [Gemmatimonadaceae bacterium]
MVWEQRWHPLRREWVVISSHRDRRPWQGETVGDARAPRIDYDPGCYLCPGNSRVSGERNPAYDGVFAFDNDHPCVGPDAPDPEALPTGPYQVRRADGLSRVVCYSPGHDRSLAELPHNEIVGLLDELQRQFRELAARREVRHVLMFENKGEVVGVSNPHPHCQIYATNFAFRTIELEAAASAEYLDANGRVLFQDIIAAEEADGRRLLASCGSALAFVPYFARYSYETFVAPRATHANIAELSRTELADLATVLGETLVRMDNLWTMPFPYVMAFHQAPVEPQADRGFHFHIEIHTPLRKPGLLKYLAGPEIGGGNFLNDTAPEEKAAELRATSTTHYRAPDVMPSDARDRARPDRGPSA